MEDLENTPEDPRVIEQLAYVRASLGMVCTNYELCHHVACQASYAIWATADEALNRLENV